jgi:hypothetical protein
MPDLPKEQLAGCPLAGPGWSGSRPPAPPKPGELFVRPLLPLSPFPKGQNPKPYAPNSASSPSPSKRPRRRQQCRHGRNVGFDFVGELASRGWHPPQERRRGNPCLPPLYSRPHLLEFLLFVSTRQFKRPMLFLGYYRWNATDSEGFVFIGIPGSQNWSSSYTQIK